MIIDSLEQHSAFEEAVGVHCSKSPGLTLLPMPQAGIEPMTLTYGMAVQCVTIQPSRLLIIFKGIVK